MRGYIRVHSVARLCFTRFFLQYSEEKEKSGYIIQLGLQVRSVCLQNEPYRHATQQLLIIMWNV